jgi:hypothetical protein
MQYDCGDFRGVHAGGTGHDDAGSGVWAVGINRQRQGLCDPGGRKRDQQRERLMAQSTAAPFPRTCPE